MKKPFKIKIFTLLAIAIVLQSCSNATENNASQQSTPEVASLKLVSSPATTYQEFPSALEGKNNIEIRSQVDGYLDKIYVEEGAFVHAGQPLFKIDSRNYSEQMNMAKANLEAAQATIQKAKVEVDRLGPLVASGVVSDVQLKTAKANLAGAVAAASQARASLGNAKITVGFTTITAPVSGYIGRIPYKKGSLISRADPSPLTLLSDISEIYAYFSLSELDFIGFQKKYQGASIEEKLKNMPQVELIIADNSVYSEKGKMSIVDGQFDKSTGAISVRAVFPNPHGSLRTGNTGRIRMPQLLSNVLVVPQESTFDIQDKTYVYTIGKDNKISSKPISISGKTEQYYFVSEGLSAGETIVFTGTGNLKDGASVKPKAISSDSLFRARPL